MTSIRRSSGSSAWTVLGVLLLLSPVLVPAAIVLGLLVALLVLLVVQAFGEDFAVGCAALAALIGLPSLVLLWLSAVLKLLGRRTLPPRARAQPPHGR